MTRPPPTTPAFRKALIKWFTANARDLPWRHNPTAYRVWVSEIMLQQTRVETVVDYFERFVERFPDVQSLADSELPDVLSAWAGLGYYRRARMLHRAAQWLRDQYDGRLPSDPLSLRALIGVGDYTSGAIASIAFNQPAPIVDGNVERVVTRWFARSGDPKRTPLKSFIRDFAAGYVTHAHDEGHAPRDANQALMELGATVCTSRNPNCATCPVSRWCSGRNRPQEFPTQRPQNALMDRQYLFALVENAGRVLVRRRESGDSVFPVGLWELPHIESATGDWAQLKRILGIRGRWVGPTADVRHSITRYRLTLTIRSLRARTAETSNDGFEYRWVTLRQLATLGTSSAIPKLLKALKHATD